MALFAQASLTDQQQFVYCTKQLQKQIAKNAEIAKNFTEQQLKDIAANKPRINGLTWDHNEQTGIMQLVDKTVHGHTGGNSIWGGGIR